MASRVDWYLVELERMLKGRVSCGELKELCAEARAHLESAKRELEEAGAGSDDAEHAAIRDFGSPARVAHRYLREMKPGRKRWAAVAVLALALGVYCMPIVGFHVGPRWLMSGGPLGASVFVWLWALMGLGFLAASALVRRPMVFGVAAAVAAGFGLMVVVTSQMVVVAKRDGLDWAVERPYADLALAEQVKYAATELQTQEKLRAGRIAFGRASNPSEISGRFRAGNEWVYPQYQSGSFSPKVFWRTTPDYRLAKSCWTSSIGSAVLEFDRQLAVRNSLAQAASDKKRGSTLDEYRWAVNFWGPAALVLGATLPFLHLVAIWLKRVFELAALRRTKLA